MNVQIPTSSVAGLAALLVVGGCERFAEPDTTVSSTDEAAMHIAGAGLSFAAPMFNKWFGVNAQDHADLALSYDSVDSTYWDHKVYYPGAKDMLIRVTGERGSGRLLGAQIIGDYGTEVSKRVDVFAAALHHGMTVEDLSDLDLSYNPPLSSPWGPVQMAAQAWVKAWRGDPCSNGVGV